MLYLILAIVSSALVSVFMRLSEGKVKGNIAMLVSNYLMCTLIAGMECGFRDLVDPSNPLLAITTAMGAVNGLFYLGGFLLFQMNIRRNGVVLSSTFMKLGLLVTLAISVCVYGEVPSVLQTLGFAVAVAAIVMINYRPGQGKAGSKLWLIWMLLVGGMADGMSKIFEESGVPGMGSQFMFFTFGTALVFCILRMVVKGQKLGKWEILYGLLVGVPNFYSSRLLLRALENVPAVIAYPVYSVGCILVVTVTGVLLFRERLEKKQWVALGLILAALVLLNV